MYRIASDGDTKTERKAESMKTDIRIGYTWHATDGSWYRDNHFWHIGANRRRGGFVVELDVSNRGTFVRCVEGRDIACAG